MEKPNRERKGEIKYNIQLNEEQKETKRLKTTKRLKINKN